MGHRLAYSAFHGMQLSTLNILAAVTTVAHSTERHVEAEWKIGRAFTVHRTDSATVQLHGLLACVPRG